MNYQEWQHSAFNKEERSCQSCHMPAAHRVRSAPRRCSATRATRWPGTCSSAATPSWCGCSTGTAPSSASRPASELEATARARRLRQLQQDTATLSRSRTPELTGGALAFDVDVRNLTGHKFPTGYPSRGARGSTSRCATAQGDTVFESGAIDETGSIVGQRQRRRIRRGSSPTTRDHQPDQVQIYEPILGDRAGVPTTGLLTATQYLKDNRLLPRGFDKTTAAAEIGVYGEAHERRRLRERRRSRALRVEVPASGTFTGSRWSFDTRRSATGGRTTSIATMLRSRSGSSPTTRRCLRLPRSSFRPRRQQRLSTDSRRVGLSERL